MRRARQAGRCWWSAAQRMSTRARADPNWQGTRVKSADQRLHRALPRARWRSGARRTVIGDVRNPYFSARSASSLWAPSQQRGWVVRTSKILSNDRLSPKGGRGRPRLVHFPPVSLGSRRVRHVSVNEGATTIFTTRDRDVPHQTPPPNPIHTSLAPSARVVG